MLCVCVCKGAGVDQQVGEDQKALFTGNVAEKAGGLWLPELIGFDRCDGCRAAGLCSVQPEAKSLSLPHTHIHTLSQRKHAYSACTMH